MGMFVAASRSSTRAATLAQRELEALLDDLLLAAPTPSS
jgi:hypothetical protein